MTTDAEQVDAAGKPVDSVLFAGGEPSKADADTLLAQYRLFVETSEALVARRQGVNTFFLTVNSAILTVVGLLLRDGRSGDLESGVLAALGFAGATLCFGWRRLLISFGQLNTGKFDVIAALERRLPAQPFTAEWAALGRGEDPKRYSSFTRTEARSPWIFGALQVLLLLTGLYMLFSEAS